MARTPRRKRRSTTRASGSTTKPRTERVAVYQISDLLDTDRARREESALDEVALGESGHNVIDPMEPGIES